MGLIIVGIVGIIVGFVTGYFVMRNNPRYFNIDDMAKVELKMLTAKIKARLGK